MGKLVSFKLLPPYVRYCLALYTFKKMFLIFSFQNFDKWCVLMFILILFCLAFVQLRESVRLLLAKCWKFWGQCSCIFSAPPFSSIFPGLWWHKCQKWKSHIFLRLQVLFLCFQSVILLLIRVNNFCFSFFRFAFSLLWAPHSAVEPIHQLKKKSSFNFWNFNLVLLIFYFFAKTFCFFHLFLSILFITH